MSKTKFNPEFVQSKATKKAKKTRKKISFGAIFSKKKPESSTRMIQFSQKSAMSIFSGVFFFLFFVMGIVLLLNFGRIDTLTRLAASKQVNPTVLLTQVNKGLSNTEQMKYDGTKFVEKLFDLNKEKIGEWENNLSPYLAQGLTASDLGFSSTTHSRESKQISFIKSETLNEAEAMYRLFYDVTFTEGNQWQDCQISFPVSFKEQELKILDSIEFLNLQVTESKNNVNYRSERFFAKGTNVSDNEKLKIEEFLKKYFELYVKNDEKLALIANVNGLEGGTFNNMQLEHIVQTKEGNYVAQGKYTFSFQKDSSFTSNFTADIKPSSDSYFITKFNE
ncbi:conjugal transfer protein [Enterococcus faecium]|uniref:conjugal transfer protein n=1 Tax=Enterococcus TaxID=1350 RepID=UPI001D1720C3|nr:conjugal transfer protein [Enterococcus faecium]MCC4053971.1 conjugal transfer protein [Enterococcus faecium]